jgi:hypothetical protein
MTPQERELIDSVFDRLARVSGAPKDAEAQALIAQRARAMPDATYNLVQAVAVQEVALKQAQAHIAELENRLQAVPAPAAGGSFLPGGNPWAAGSQRGGGMIPQSGPQPQGYAQQGYAQPASPWAQPQAPMMGGGGFLRQAATTAAGVAGGVLLAEGISSLFGGHHGGGGFGGGGAAAAPAEYVENTTVNNYYSGSGTADDGGSFMDIGDGGVDDSGGGDWS